MKSVIKSRFFYKIVSLGLYLVLISQPVISLDLPMPQTIPQNWRIEKVEPAVLWKQVLGSSTTLQKLLGIFPGTTVSISLDAKAHKPIDITNIQTHQKTILDQAALALSAKPQLSGAPRPFRFQIDYRDLARQVAQQQNITSGRTYNAMQLTTLIDELFYENKIFFTDLLLQNLRHAVDRDLLTVRSDYLFSAPGQQPVYYDGFTTATGEKGLIASADGTDGERYLRFTGPVKGYFGREIRKLNMAIGWKKIIEDNLHEIRTSILDGSKNYITRAEQEQLIVNFKEVRTILDVVVNAFDAIQTTQINTSFGIAMNSNYYIPDEEAPFCLLPGSYNTFSKPFHDTLRKIWFATVQKKHDNFHFAREAINNKILQFDSVNQ
jgi:hypothetical protein